MTRELMQLLLCFLFLTPCECAIEDGTPESLPSIPRPYRFVALCVERVRINPTVIRNLRPRIAKLACKDACLHDRESEFKLSGIYHYLPEQIVLDGAKENYLHFNYGTLSAKIIIKNRGVNISGDEINVANSINLADENSDVTFALEKPYAIRAKLIEAKGGTFFFKSHVYIPASTIVMGPITMVGCDTRLSLWSGKYSYAHGQHTRSARRRGKWSFVNFSHISLHENLDVTEPWVFAPKDYPMCINGNLDFIVLRGNGKLIFDSSRQKITLKNLIIVNDTGRKDVVEFIGDDMEIVDGLFQVTDNAALYDFCSNPLPNKLYKNNQEKIVKISQEASQVVYQLSCSVALQEIMPLDLANDTIIDGGGFTINFGRQHKDPFVLSSGTKLTFKNVTLKNFSPKMFSLQDDGQVFFGEGCVLELKESISLDQLFQLCVVGKVIVIGKKNSLHATSAGSINVAAGATLYLQNCRLKLADAKALNLAPTANLELDDCVIGCKTDLCINQGKLSIGGKVAFYSANPVEGKSVLTLDQEAEIYIKKESKLILPGSMTLCLAKPTATITFADAESSQLFLDHSQIIITQGSAQFVAGKIVIEGQVKIETPLQQPLLLQDTTLQILPHANLVVHGSLRYKYTVNNNYDV